MATDETKTDFQHLDIIYYYYKLLLFFHRSMMWRALIANENPRPEIIKIKTTTTIIIRWF